MDNNASPSTTMTNKTVTCHEATCANSEIPITIVCSDTIYCGVCGVQITDIKAAPIT